MSALMVGGMVTVRLSQLGGEANIGQQLTDLLRVDANVGVDLLCCLCPAWVSVSPEASLVNTGSIVTILTEHGHQAGQDDAGLGQLCRRHCKEDVLGVVADLGVLSVDDTALTFLDFKCNET